MESSYSSSCSIAFSPVDSSHSTTHLHHQQSSSSSPSPPQYHHTKGKRARSSLIPLPNATVPDQDNSHPDMSSSEAAAAIRKYRGIRMRKWGKWVAEIREPNKRSRIWLGSYSTPVAAARAYDTAVFFLRGKSARLNFPEEINKEPEAAGVLAGSSGGLSAASIRQKAAEVGARVDALHAGTGAGGAEQRQRQHRNSNRVKKEEDMDEDDDEDVRLAAQMAASKVASTTTTTTTSAVLWKKPDLNRQPSPECSDDEEY